MDLSCDKTAGTLSSGLAGHVMVNDWMDVNHINAHERKGYQVEGTLL